jgi:hypothetical protein
MIANSKIKFNSHKAIKILRSISNRKENMFFVLFNNRGYLNIYQKEKRKTVNYNLQEEKNKKKKENLFLFNINTYL